MDTAAPSSVRDLLDAWPRRRDLAAEIGAPPERVFKWGQKGRIPAEFWLALIRAAQARGLAHVTAEWLAEIHQRHPGPVMGDAANPPAAEPSGRGSPGRARTRNPSAKGSARPA